MPLFGQVPNTTTFSFLDVKDEIESNGGATTNSLVDAFANANAGGFDPAYEGSKNALLNFRNYSHLQGFRYSGDSYTFTTEQTAGKSIFFKPDGTKMYIGGDSPSEVSEYDLSPAWDITTSTYNNNVSYGTGNNFYSIHFKSDGTQLYNLGFSSDVTVRQYTLSTAWDITTASIVVSSILDLQGGQKNGLYIKPDGTTFYVAGGSTAGVYQYTMSTPWSMATESYASIMKDISAQVTIASGVFFKDDGTKMYVTDVFDSRINEYSLSTAWNVSTASYVRDYFFGSQMTDVYIRSGGEEFYPLTSSTVYQYITDFPWSIED